MNKFKFNQLGSSCINYAKLENPIRTHETWQENLFNIPRFQTNIFVKIAWVLETPKLWKSLPTNVQTSLGFFVLEKGKFLSK